MKVNDELHEQRILDRARDLISRRGLKGWNMDQISAAAGLTKPTLYKIITSKEKLIERIILNDIRTMQARMLEIIDRENDYTLALEKMLVQYPAFFENGHTNYMHEVLAEYPSIEQKVLAHNDEVTDQLIKFIRKGISIGKLRKDVKPEIIFDLLKAVIHYNVTSGMEGKERADKIKSMFNIAMSGIREA